MKPILAIPQSELTHRTPRGLPRVARRIAEEFAKNPQFECYCITEVIASTRKPVFRCQRLATWLQTTPLKTPEQIRTTHPVFEEIKSLLRSMTPSFLWLSLASIYKRLRHRIDSARHFIRQSQPDAGLSSANHLDPVENEFWGLDDLDLLICLDPQDPLFACDLMSSRCRVLTFIHDAIPLRIHEGKYWNPQKFAGDLRRAINSSQILACNSRCTRDDVGLFFGTEAATRTIVVPLGHDSERFSRELDPVDKKRILHQFGLTDRRFFLVLGRIEDRKNVANLARAAELLAAKLGRHVFSLVLAGDPHEADRYSELFKYASQSVDIRVVGFVSEQEAVALLQESIALLFVSLWEGFGMPLLEAMSARTLIITSDVSSMPEVAGEHAIYCDPYDPRSIANAMEVTLTLTSDERISRVSAAAEYAKDFTWAKCASLLADTILADCLIQNRAKYNSIR